jgi:hypothetical protein
MPQGWLGQPAAVVIGALIAAFSAIAVALFSQWRAARLERDKWTRTAAESFAAKLHASAQELTTTLASAIHSMSWLCWIATHAPQRLSKALIDAYFTEMHGVLPRLLGAHAAIAVLSPDAYAQLRDLVHKVIALDERIGKASLVWREGEPATAAELVKCLDEGNELEATIGDRVAQALRPYAPVAEPSRVQST